MKRRRFGWICALLAAFILSTGVLLALPSEIADVSHRSLLATLTIYGIGSVFAFASYLLIHNHNRELDNDGTGDIENELGTAGTVSREYASACMRRAYSTYNDAEIELLVAACCDPSILIKRTVEHVELLPTRVRRRIARELLVPPGKRRRVVFPVLRQSKSALVDEVEISADGKNGYTLSHSESIGVTALLLRHLYVGAFLPPGGGALDKSHQERFQFILTVAFASSKQRVNGQSRLLRQLETMRPYNDITKLDFMAVFEFLISRYFIFQELWVDKAQKHPTRVDVDVTTSDNRSNLLSRKLSVFKVALGVGVHEWLLDLAGIFETSSYHLRCRCPEGTYLYRVGVERQQLGGASVQQLAGSVNAPKQVRIARTRGTDTVHFYASGFNQFESNRRLYLRLKLYFRAIPPGLLGPVTILSLYLAAITNIFAWHHNALFTAKSSAALTLLLAIPGLMTGWIAGRLNSKSIWTSSHIFLLQLGGLLALSAIASTVAVLKVATTSRTSWEIRTWFGSMITIHHPVWFMTCLLCTAHFALCLGDLASRTWRYQRCLRDR